METIDDINKKVDEVEFEGVKETVLVYEFPDDVKQTFISENETTFILPVNLYDDLERDVINTAVNDIDEIANNRLDSDSDLTINITGPSGIASDTTDLFSRGDLTLLFGTIALIFVILIAVYRTPIIAFVRSEEHTSEL